MSGRVIIVVGGQYGSEGKGSVAGWIARHWGNIGATVRVGGPNAGHTSLGLKLQQVPVGVTNPDLPLYIGPGSEIDLDILMREVEKTECSVTVDPNAVVINHDHTLRDQSLVGVLGSTGKGVGSARADHIMRKSSIVRDLKDLPDSIRVSPAGLELDEVLDEGKDVLVEASQGFGLGLRTSGNYPFTTSRDCRAIDAFVESGISPVFVDKILPVVVFRAFPIRTGGNSGPMYKETTWSELDLPEERTTVTNRVRRVGQWDDLLASSAIHANRCGGKMEVALTMLDHLDPYVFDGDKQIIRRVIHKHFPSWFAKFVTIVGTGPDRVSWL